MPDLTYHRALAAVERMDRSACGALSILVEDQPAARIFVEAGLVCWAATTGLAHRLRDLLAEHLPPSLDAADRFVAMCEAIRMHTIESLLSFPQDQGEHLAWSAHRADGYHAGFGFTPLALLVEANRALYATEAASANDAPAPEGVGATFVPRDGGGLVAVATSEGLTTIHQLDELASWADAAFGVTRGFSPAVIESALAAARGDTWIAWRSSRLLTHVAVMPAGPELADLAARIQERRIPLVISRRTFRAPLTSRDELGTVEPHP